MKSLEGNKKNLIYNRFQKGGCGDLPTLPQLTSANLKGFSQKAVSHPVF